MSTKQLQSSNLKVIFHPNKKLKQEEQKSAKEENFHRQIEEVKFLQLFLRFRDRRVVVMQQSSSRFYHSIPEENVPINRCVIKAKLLSIFAVKFGEKFLKLDGLEVKVFSGEEVEIAHAVDYLEL